MYAQILLFMFILCVGASDWGTIFPTPDGVQANGWIVGVKEMENIVDSRLFETASPPTPNAPNTQAGGRKITDLALNGVAIGRGSALISRAYTNAYPQSFNGKEKIPAPGVSYADSGAAMIDIGLPNVGSPNEGPQVSPIGVHLEACITTALSIPGKPIIFKWSCAEGYVSTFGEKIMDISPASPANLKIRIPSDESQPKIADIIINEQVTTDNKGNPTIDRQGNATFDPKATSGYVNAVHIITNLGEMTAFHAAVIRDAKKTDQLAPKLPKPPGFIDKMIRQR